MNYGGGKTWGGSGKCRVVYFGQSTGVLREVERRLILSGSHIIGYLPSAFSVPGIVLSIGMQL